MAIDLNRIATAAVESFLQEPGEQRARQDERRSRLGGLGAVAAGVGLAVAARAVYSRARHLDLAQLAGAVEDKLGE